MLAENTDCMFVGVYLGLMPATTAHACQKNSRSHGSALHMHACVIHHSHMSTLLATSFSLLTTELSWKNSIIAAPCSFSAYRGHNSQQKGKAQHGMAQLGSVYHHSTHSLIKSVSETPRLTIPVGAVSMQVACANSVHAILLLMLLLLYSTL
jgi:hypothetical protein